MSPNNENLLTSTTKPDVDNDSSGPIQYVDNNFDVAHDDHPDHPLLSPTPGGKEADPNLLNPEAFRRPSMGSISSIPPSRGVSPFDHPNPAQNGWRGWPRRSWERNHGLILVTISQLFGALMNVTTRLLELEGEGMEPFQILFARMLLTTIFCFGWMRWKNVPDFPLGAKGIRGLLVARGLTGFFGIWGMYYSLQYLALSDAIVITFLAPTVASYGCYLFFREPFPRSAQYASLISLIGVLLIARPTSFFSSSPPASEGSPSDTTTPYEGDFPTPTSGQRLSAVGAAMLGVLGSAGAYTTIRWIGSRAHPLISVNYFAVWCTIVSTLALSLSQPLHLSSTLHFALPSNARQWIMLIFLGVCGFAMQFLLTMGLAAGGRGDGVRATNMVYTNMLFALVLDKLVFNQSPGWWSLAGSGLILGSVIYVAMQKQQNGDVGDEAAIREGMDEEEGRGRPQGQ